jgi:ribonuclease P protein component
MLPKTKRLRAEEVQDILAHGTSRRAGVLSLKKIENKGDFRCAVVVSKKLARTAVMRNRLRRAVYKALSETSLPRHMHAILFVQSIPPRDLVATFSLELKKLLHV